MKFHKVEESSKMLKGARKYKKKTNIIQKNIRLAAEFSIRTMVARNYWDSISNTLKGNNYHHRILHPEKKFFRNKVK